MSRPSCLPHFPAVLTWWRCPFHGQEKSVCLTRPPPFDDILQKTSRSFAPGQTLAHHGSKCVGSPAKASRNSLPPPQRTKHCQQWPGVGVNARDDAQILQILWCCGGPRPNSTHFWPSKFHRFLWNLWNLVGVFGGGCIPNSTHSVLICRI